MIPVFNVQGKIKGQRGGRQRRHDYLLSVVILTSMFDGFSKHLHSKLPDISGREGPSSKWG